MNGMILGLLAETFLHPGSGQNEGAIDLPVAREKPTDYPFVPGSGVKGAMRDKAFLLAKAEAAKNTTTLEAAVEEACTALDVLSFKREATRWARERIDKLAETERSKPGEITKAAAESAVEVVYGRPDGAGNLILSDAKLLLLPVRSLTSAYVWLTSPHLVERYVRDRGRVTGSRPDVPNLNPYDNTIIMSAGNGRLFLEELSFAIDAQPTEIRRLAQALGDLVAEPTTTARIEAQIAVVSDRRFAWFARHGLPVAARNVLDDNKVSKNLWYEESLPPDTVLFAMAFERRAGLLDHLRSGLFRNGAYLQLGGNETIGQGWFKVALG